MNIDDASGGVVDGTTNTTTTTTTTSTSEPPSLITCSFNQDGGCLAIGTTTGFSVHNVHPQYSLSVERELRGGIGHVEMLFRCNLMALVGGGPTPHSAPHRVLIWDDHVPKEIGELSFRQSVLQVKLRKDAIAVALRDRVYVYHLADLSLRDKIYTADNPHGLLSLSTQVQKDMVLACPSVTTGHVRVELYGLRKTMLLEAHEGTLRALALTSDGSLLATASTKGTLIRVWKVQPSSSNSTSSSSSNPNATAPTSSSSCIYTFRRGVERATITCLAFSWDNQWLSCTSDKGTAHVFYCGDHINNNSSSSSSSSSPKKKSLTKRLLGSVTSTAAAATSAATSSSSSSSAAAVASLGRQDIKKSVCQVRGIPHPLACAFIGDVLPNIIAVAGWDADGNGVLLISEFAAHQEPRRIAYHVLLHKASSSMETEEERRRRRARGWKPSKPSTPSALLETLQITEATMHHQVVSHDEDDFCEVIVETTTTTTTTPPSSEEPVIDDAPQETQQPQPHNEYGDNVRPTQDNPLDNNNTDDNNNAAPPSFFEKEDSARNTPMGLIHNATDNNNDNDNDTDPAQEIPASLPPTPGLEATQ